MRSGEKQLHPFILLLAFFFVTKVFAQVVPTPVQPAQKDSVKGKNHWPKYKVEAKASVPKGHGNLRIDILSPYWPKDRMLPYELLLIDPQGERLGCDGRSGKHYNEIKDGIYEKTYEENIDGNEFPIIQMDIDQPIIGDYTLKMYCKETDFYSLTIAGKDIFWVYGEVVFHQIEVHENEIHEYSFIFPEKIRKNPNGTGTIEVIKITKKIKNKIR